MKHWSNEQIHALASYTALNRISGVFPGNKPTERDPYLTGAPTRFYLYIRVLDRVWEHFGEPSSLLLQIGQKATRYRQEKEAPPETYLLAEVDRSNLLLVYCRIPKMGINAFRTWQSPLLQTYHTKAWQDLCRYRWITGKQTRKYRFKPAFEIQEQGFIDKWKSLPIKQQLENNF